MRDSPLKDSIEAKSPTSILPKIELTIESPNLGKNVIVTVEFEESKDSSIIIASADKKEIIEGVAMNKDELLLGNDLTPLEDSDLLTDALA